MKLNRNELPLLRTQRGVVHVCIGPREGAKLCDSRGELGHNFALGPVETVTCPRCLKKINRLLEAEP